jgi:hypothetical protein
MRATNPQLEISPPELTIADCFAGRFSVTAWCSNRCNGRNLDLSVLGAWTDHKLLDLMRDGSIVCRTCGSPATAVNVSVTERADRVLFWQIGDDAMPVLGG